MDWHMMWVIAMTMPSEIVMLILVLATVATYFIYFFYHTGFVTSTIAFLVMSAAGFLGHAYFLTNRIFFDYDIGRSAIVGATLSMAVSFIISIFIIRIIMDAVYSRYRHSSKKKSHQFHPRQRF